MQENEERERDGERKRGGREMRSRETHVYI